MTNSIKEKVVVIMGASSGIGEVETELYKTISDKEVSRALHEQQIKTGLKPEDISSAVVYAIDTPGRMVISDMIIRPVSQKL